MEDELPVKFTKNNRLIKKGDGSHIGGSLFTKPDDLINNIKMDKNGLTFLE